MASSINQPEGEIMNRDPVRTMTSPCGLPCFHCPAHHALENPELRETLSAVLGVPPDKTTCQGCRPSKGKIAFLHPEKTCRVFLCTTEKNIEFCHECDDFPCERLHPYADQANLPHNTKMYQLCMMKKLGLERWAVEEAAKIWDTYRTKPFDFDDILY
jgi:hypothetical protein